MVIDKPGNDTFYSIWRPATQQTARALEAVYLHSVPVSVGRNNDLDQYRVDAYTAYLSFTTVTT